MPGDILLYEASTGSFVTIYKKPSRYPLKFLGLLGIKPVPLQGTFHLYSQKI